MTPLRSLRPCAALILAIATASCAQFPELDGTVPPSAEAADYPALVPLEPLLSGIEASSTTAEAEVGAINSRVARLRDRANRLRRGVVDGETRTRMSGGVDAPQG